MFDVSPIGVGEVTVGAEFDAAAIYARTGWEFMAVITKPEDFLLTNPGSPTGEIDPMPQSGEPRGRPS